MTRIRFATTAGVVLALSAATAFAAGNPVADRQAAMKAIGQGMKDASGLVSGAFDAAKAKTVMTGIATNAKKAHSLFKPGTDNDPKTEADPKIWAQKADFDKRMNELAAAASAASKASTQDAFKPAFQKVGGTCKSCHDVYRKKKT